MQIRAVLNVCNAKLISVHWRNGLISLLKALGTMRPEDVWVNMYFCLPKKQNQTVQFTLH